MLVEYEWNEFLLWTYPIGSLGIFVFIFNWTLTGTISCEVVACRWLLGTSKVNIMIITRNIDILTIYVRLGTTGGVKGLLVFLESAKIMHKRFSGNNFRTITGCPRYTARSWKILLTWRISHGPKWLMCCIHVFEILW